MLTKVTLLFSGQGSQYSGMGKNICKKSKIADTTFDMANEVLNFNIKKLCFDGREEELLKTEIAQPAILTTSIAYYRAFTEFYETEPMAAAGHSLGEYSALVASGCLSFEDALRIVRKRGEYMALASERTKGAMYAIIGVSIKEVEDMFKKYKDKNNIYISNYNSPRQVTISGGEEETEEFASMLVEKGATAIKLGVSGAFHTTLMKVAADKMKEVLEEYELKPLKFPVISNVSARPHELTDIKDNLVKQITNPVRWKESIDYLLSQNKQDLFIELGPKNVLKNLNIKIKTDLMKNTFSMENDEELISLFINKGEIDGHSDIDKIKKCYSAIVCTRNRCFSKERYQKEVVEQANIIKDMCNLFMQSKKSPSEEEIRKAIVITKHILEAKGVSSSGWNKRLKGILS